MKPREMKECKCEGEARTVRKIFDWMYQCPRCGGLGKINTPPPTQGDDDVVNLTPKGEVEARRSEPQGDWEKSFDVKFSKSSVRGYGRLADYEFYSEIKDFIRNLLSHQPGLDKEVLKKFLSPHSQNHEYDLDLIVGALSTAFKEGKLNG